MDLAWVRREVRKIYIRKAAQVGVSEAVRNILLHMAMSEPDPALLVLPDEKTGKRVMGKRILPLFEDTPTLQSLATSIDRDQGLTQVLLANGFNLQLGWTGSAATMAADPARLWAWDETDKSKGWDGKESGVAELLDVRTATYENSLGIAMSTPTTADGPITELTESAEVKLWFKCPCPECGYYQTLAFERVRYPKPGVELPAKVAELTKIDPVLWDAICNETNKKKKSALVTAHRAAWYECEKCKAAIVDHQKQRMLLAGYWGTDDDGYKLFVDGHEEGAWPVGSEVGMHYPATLSLAPKHRFPLMAAEWIRCQGDAKRTQGFRNSWQGEPFKIEVQRTQPDKIREKKNGAPPPLIVPNWAKVLIATADVQGQDPSTGYFYYVIRAWGYEYRSQLIDYGIVNTFEELREKCLDRSTHPLQLEGGGFCQPQLLLIDSGNRSNEVYQFCLSDVNRIKPTKGANRILSWPVEKRLQKTSGVILWSIDTQQTKDLLNRLIHSPDAKQWQVHDQVNDDYCQQLASENKVWSKKHRREMWETKTTSTPNHLLDCEQQQCAAAWDLGCGMTEPEQTAQPQQAPSESYNPLNYRGRW